MATARQIAANRLNAQKSTGPKTDEGKERSRENAVTHGLACEVVVPPGDNEVAFERSEYWHTSLRPLTRFDNYLVDLISIASVRIDRCQAHEQDLRERAAARAASCWEEDRTLAAEKVALKLSDQPALVRLQLRQSPQGCRWLIVRWTMLIRVLRDAGAWTPAQKSLALDLLGVAADLREAASPFDAPAADPLAVAEAELDSLRSKAEVVAPLDAADREHSEFGKPVEPDRMMTLVRRYEAAAARQLRWALKQIKAPRPMLTTPLPAYQRPTTHPVVAPAAAPEAREPRERNEPTGGPGKMTATPPTAKPVPAKRGTKRHRLTPS